MVYSDVQCLCVTIPGQQGFTPQISARESRDRGWLWGFGFWGQGLAENQAVSTSIRNL
mgnify:CR=1 FL=1